MIKLNDKEVRYMRKGFIGNEVSTFSWNQWFQESPDVVIESLKKK